MAKDKVPESVKSLLDIYQQPFVLVDAGLHHCGVQQGLCGPVQPDTR